MMTTGDIATQLGVSAGTVRRWSNAFSDFLSGGAHPPKGEVRHFTEDDLELLTAVAYYSKKQHRNYDAIHEKLKAGDHSRESIPTPAELRGGKKPAQPVATAPTTQAMWPAELDNLAQEIGALVDAERSVRRTVPEQLEMLKQQIDGLESRLDALARLDDLQTQLGELWRIANRRARDEALRLQRLAHLEQQIEQLQTTLEERPARRALRRLHSVFNSGVGKMVAQTISWMLFLIAALGMLYYLELTIVPTVLLAIGIALILWLAGKQFAQR